MRIRWAFTSSAVTVRNQPDGYFRLSDLTAVLIFQLPGSADTEQMIVVKQTPRNLGTVGVSSI